METQVTFKFERGQRVHIVDIDRPGVVTALLLDDSGRCYKVCYWNNGERKDAWLYEHEIREEK